jgi:hypothetical protein
MIDTSTHLSYKDLCKIRKIANKHPASKSIFAQKGGQENMLKSAADITIGGGCRGGSKTFSLLLEAAYDMNNPNFRALILRNEIEDLSDIAETSDQIFGEFGERLRSKTDQRWVFNRGGFLRFSYHADSYDEFKKRFQGRQFSYIGVDEITHMEYLKFKYLITCNRNAFGIRNRFFGTCNPDPDSWVAKFIDWWIGEDGLPIAERDSVVRYCFMDGDSVDSIYWGNTRNEVYEQCHSIIDRYWLPEYSVYGEPQDLFIKSVAFVEAKLHDNVKLLASDPTYLANLANQSEEQRARDLEGNWKYKDVGDDFIKQSHLEAFFNNSVQVGDGVRRCSCDVAFDGGDACVLWLIVGHHVEDLFVSRLDSRSTVNVIKAKLEEWGVREENFTYDLNGLGQTLKGFFPRALPFCNTEAVDDKYKNVYHDLKSQAAYLFARDIINGEYSINPELLKRKYSGRGYENTPLAQILNRERKAIRQDDNDDGHGWKIIKKVIMKRLVGHSPDFMEGLLMIKIFDIKKRNRHFKGLGLL